MTKSRDLANAATALNAVTATEIGYVDGVTSAIQTQLNAKQAVVSGVDDTEIGYLNGVTSAIQTQLDAKTAKSTLTTTGDIYYASSANTPARLGIGSTGQLLTVASGIPSWAAPAGGGKVLQVVQGTTTTETVVSSTTYTDTTLTASITPSAATSKILIIFAQGVYQARNANTSGVGIKLLRGATDIYDIGGGGTQTAYFEATGVTAWGLRNIVTGTYLDSPSTTSSTTYKTQGRVYLTTSSGSCRFQEGSIPSTIILMEIGA